MGIFGPSDVLFKEQNYSELRKAAVESGTAFVDSEFPARDQSISTSSRGFVEWKRPSEICSDPRLVVDGVSSHDLIQGELGNCWLVAACSCLATDHDTWAQVVPDLKTQEYDPNSKHPGIFHFRFWRYGRWTDVVIDDQLPCRGNKLIFSHSASKNEFWSALLEKAYAKLYGSYEALDGGELAVALEDFTGGVSEITNLKKEESLEKAESREEFFLSIKRQFRDHALMAASIPAESQDEMEKPTAMGLVIGHAYSVTAVKRIFLKGTGLFSFLNREKLPMIRLRNPWGGAEWKGAFSDGSEEWAKITSSARSKIGLTFDEDGEFWMTFDDFCSNFHHLAVCHRLNISCLSLNRWYLTDLSGEWAGPDRCGGCVNYKDTFLQNPQFVFTMTADEEEEVIIVLTQKNVKEQGDQLTAIGFTVLKVEENRTFRLHRLPREAFSSEFINRRSVLLRKKVTKGRYVVVACKFRPAEVGPFLLRVYLRCRGKALALEQDEPVEGCMSCLPSHQLPSLVSQVTVVRAVNLVRKDGAESTDAYVVLKNEGNKVQSIVVKNSANPEFNVSALFYRRRPSQEGVVVEVWHRQVFFDEFIGSASLEATEIIDHAIKEYPITSKDGSKVGGVVVRFSTNQNLAAF